MRITAKPGRSTLKTKPRPNSAQETQGRGRRRSDVRKRSPSSVQERQDLGLDRETWRRNAQKLIRAGAIIAIASDNTVTFPPEFTRPPKPDYRQAGIASLIAIEGMVEIGMTPVQAITAGTSNGAMASGGFADFGTIEAGKSADLVLLDANPLSEIRNIRKQHVVMKEGRIVDVHALPEQPVLYRGSPKTR